MVREAVVGLPFSSFMASLMLRVGVALKRIEMSLRKPMSWVPWPTSKPRMAARGPASRLKTSRMTYSISRPERRSCKGGLRKKLSWVQRSLMSDVVMGVALGLTR